MNQNVKLSQYPVLKQRINQLNYAFTKSGSGEALIFLHGFPDHSGSWDTIIEHLSPSYTCIAPFLRGYYPTDIPLDANYTMQNIASDIHQLATSLGHSRYTVVGHDWGASIAYVMANLYPKEVKKVVALNMPHPKYLKPSLSLLLKARHIFYFSNKRKAPKRLSRNDYQYLNTLYKRWSPNLDYSELKTQMVFCFDMPGRKEAALGYYQQLGKEAKSVISTYQALPNAPVLTLAGLEDGTIDLYQFKQMENNPSFTVRYFQAGHFLHKEAPMYCVRQIKDFLNDKHTIL